MKKIMENTVKRPKITFGYINIYIADIYKQMVELA